MTSLPGMMFRFHDLSQEVFDDMYDSNYFDYFG